MNYTLKLLGTSLMGLWLIILFLSCGDSVVGSIGGDSEITDILRFCSNSAQCNKDEECVNNRCVKRQNLCRNKSDCSADEECVEGICVSVTDIINDGGETIKDIEDSDTSVLSQKIKAEPEEVDFGALRYGEKAEKRLLIKNGGDSPLKVFKITLKQDSNNEVFAFNTDFLNNTSLQPGESFEITVSCTQNDAEPDTGYLYVSSDDAFMPLLEVRLFNSYKDPPDVKVTYISSGNSEVVYPEKGDGNKISLMLGNIPVGDRKVQIFKLINAAEYGILMIKGVTFDPFNNNDTNLNKFSGRLYEPVGDREVTPPIYLSGGEYIELRVEYDAVVESQEDKYDVHIEFNDADVNNDGDKSEDGLLIFNLSSQAGYVPPKIAILNLDGVDIIGSGIDFGGVEIDGSEKGYFKICNVGGGHLEIDKRSGLMSGNFVLNPASLETVLSYSQCLNADLTFSPSAIGDVKDTVVVYSNDANNKEVSFLVTGKGVNPEIKVEPKMIDFGSVAVNTKAAPQSVRITNIGVGTLSIKGIEISRGSSSDFSLNMVPQIFPVNLNSWDFIDFEVGFGPSDIGSKSGEVIISSSDRHNLSVSIPLQGSGSNCDSNHMDCNNNPVDGCETDITKSREHCGGCNRLCSLQNATAKCTNKECVIDLCNAGFADCNMRATDGCEIYLLGDPTHCGNCNTNCRNLYMVDSVSCSNGNCVINSCIIEPPDIYGNCDGNVSNGCEVDLTNDANNCGSCNNRCNQNAYCFNGSCRCAVGYANCNNNWADGCELFLSEDIPDDTFSDTNCDGIDGDKNRAIFVDTNAGSDSNSGLWGSPVKTITKGIEKASVYNPPRYLLVSEGTYNETFNLHSGVSIYGGYSRVSGWSRSNSYIVNVNVASTGIRANGISMRTDIDRINIYAADAAGASATSYGMFLQNSTNVYINRCTVKSGKGGDGVNGTNGANGLQNDPNTMNGRTGQPGCEDSSGLCDDCSQPQGGAGGTSVCGMHGGRGGNAGRSSNWGSSGSAGIGPSGQGGAAGAGGPPERGSAPPLSSQYGGNGADGANGTNGAAGVAFGSHSPTGYVASNSGGNGGQGAHGAGGGGGGGGGGGTADCDSYGSSGGGGGAGGCGGYGGTGGGGGGASIGIYLSYSTVNVSYSTVSSANGGNGGGGGVGGTGSAGGASGAGGQYGGGGEQDDGSMGGPGGNGGRGGNGGYGGGGGGGPSVCIMKYGTSNANITSVTFLRGSGGSGGWGGGVNSGWNGISVDIYP